MQNTTTNNTSALETHYPQFTEAMRRDYTILVPNMLPIQLGLMCRLMKNYGYCEICSTDVLNFVASIFARGDAKE